MPTKWLQGRPNGSKNDPGMPPRRASRGSPLGPCSGIMPRALWWPKVWGLFLLSKVPLFRQVASDRAARGSPATERFAERGERFTARDFFVDNLLVRSHCIIVLIRWTGLAPCKFEFPSPGSLPISSRQLSQFNSRRKEKPWSGCGVNRLERTSTQYCLDAQAPSKQWKYLAGSDHACSACTSKQSCTWNASSFRVKGFAGSITLNLKPNRPS